MVLRIEEFAKSKESIENHLRPRNQLQLLRIKKSCGCGPKKPRKGGKRRVFFGGQGLGPREVLIWKWWLPSGNPMEFRGLEKFWDTRMPSIFLRQMLQWGCEMWDSMRLVCSDWCKMISPRKKNRSVTDFISDWFVRSAFNQTSWDRNSESEKRNGSEEKKKEGFSTCRHLLDFASSVRENDLGFSFYMINDIGLVTCNGYSGLDVSNRNVPFWALEVFDMYSYPMGLNASIDSLHPLKLDWQLAVCYFCLKDLGTRSDEKRGGQIFGIERYFAFGSGFDMFDVFLCFSTTLFDNFIWSKHRQPISRNFGPQERQRREEKRRKAEEERLRKEEAESRGRVVGKTKKWTMLTKMYSRVL